MKRKHQTLVDIVRDMMERHQESILHVTKTYPEHLRTWHYQDQTKRYTQRTVEAILDHLRTVDAEERAEMEQELWG
jgi:hypothetical protein